SWRYDAGRRGRLSTSGAAGGDLLDRARVLQRAQVAQVRQAQVGAADDPTQDFGVARVRQLAHEEHRFRLERLAELARDRGLHLGGQGGTGLVAGPWDAEDHD